MKTIFPESFPSNRAGAFRFLPLTALLIGLLAAPGCFQKRFVWSPDGQWGAGVSEAGLFLCDAEGRTSDILIGDADCVSWMPNSKELLVARHDSLGRWKEIESRLPAETLDRIRRLGDLALAELRDRRDWNRAFEALKQEHRLEDNERAAVQVYLRDVKSSALNRLNAPPESIPDDLEVELRMIQIVRVDYPKIEIKRTLADGILKPVFEILPSPKGNVAAYVAGEDRFSLHVMTLDGSSEPMSIGEFQISLYPDWSSDGQSLAFARALNEPEEKSFSLGAISRKRVWNSEGAFDPDSEIENLAGLLFDPMSKVRCLKDGRIVFSSRRITLPLTEKEAPKQQQLFVLDPNRQSTVSHLIPQETLDELPDALNWFEVSPDEKQIAIADENGRVYLLEIFSGEATEIQEHPGRALQTIPVWKYPDSLCYIQIPEPDTGNPQELVLRDPSGRIKALSEDWPAKIRNGLLED